MGNDGVRREAQDDRTCPVCGQTLPTEANLRRCPTCGAKLLWRRPCPDAADGIVLFNARLCGIVIGMETSMLALLALGYRLPLPYGVMIGAAALPVAAYLLTSATTPKVRPESRRGYLVFLMSTVVGLLVALMAATLGVSGPGLLLMIAALAGVLSSRLISRHVSFDDEY